MGGGVVDKEYRSGGEPLFYIEQPSFQHPSQTGQTVSVTKKIGKKEGKHKRKAREKDKKKAREAAELVNQQEEFEKKEPEDKTGFEREEERKNGLDKTKTKPIDQEVMETMEYLKQVPHFIRPVVSCETENGLVKGNVIGIKEEEVIIQEANKVAPVTVHVKDILRLHVVSL